MFKTLLDKFERNIDLKLKLRSTENKYIEETNHWEDIYWGC